MGHNARQQVWRLGAAAELSPTERLLLLAIADHIPDGEWIGWPAVATLAEMTSIGDRQAQRIIAGLEARAVLAVARGIGRTHSSRYVILAGLSDDERRAALVALKGDAAMSPFNGGKGDISRGKGDIKHDIAMSPFIGETERKGDIQVQKGDIAMSPEQKEQNLHGDSGSGERPPLPAAAPAPTERSRTKRERDPNQQHPACIVFAELTGKRPNRVQAAAIAEAITPECVPRWRAAVEAWLKSGWNSQNVTGMLDKYRKGARNGTGTAQILAPRTGGVDGHPVQPAPATAGYKPGGAAGRSRRGGNHPVPGLQPANRSQIIASGLQGPPDETAE